jgi:hypothetical protein
MRSLTCIYMYFTYNIYIALFRSNDISLKKNLQMFEKCWKMNLGSIFNPVQITSLHQSLIGWDRINGGPVSQQLWHVKEPSLLKTISAKHRSKFAALSPVTVAAARWVKKLPVWLLFAAINKVLLPRSRPQSKIVWYLRKGLLKKNTREISKRLSFQK